MRSEWLPLGAFEATVRSKWLPQGGLEATVRSKWLASNVFESTVRSNWLPAGGAFKATVHSGPLLGATGALELASAPQGVQRSCSKHRCAAILSLVSLHSLLHTNRGLRKGGLAQVFFSSR